MTILPTGQCFNDALEFAEALARGDPLCLLDLDDVGFPDLDLHTLLLVHGIAHAVNPTGNLRVGDPYAHAWLEQGDKVLHAGLWEGRRVYVVFARAGYYQRHRIEDATAYTLREACRHNAASGHYGPWEERYLKLCREPSPPPQPEGDRLCK